MSMPQQEVPSSDWDLALQRLHGHFLQSSPWQRVQQALGYAVVTDRGDDWMWSAYVRAGKFPRYMYVPYGPVGASGGDEALESLLRAAGKHRLDFVRMEPDFPGAATVLHAAHAVRVRAVQPRWTWVLDLASTVEDLRRGLSSGHRGDVNAAPRRGLRIRHSNDPDDIDILLRLQRSAAARSGYGGMSRDYHRTVARQLMPSRVATLYVVEAEGDALAASLCFDFGDTRYYAFAATDPARGRKLGASTPLVWQMLVDARAAGKQQFDFWGVRPNAPPGHPWRGFSQFKMAFGGRLVERTGTWEVSARPLRHRLYSMTQRLLRR